MTVYAETPVTESTTLEKNEEIDNTSSITRPIAVEDPKVVQANENKEGEVVDSSSIFCLTKIECRICFS